MGFFNVLFIIVAVQITKSYAACSRRGVECIEYHVVSRHQGYEERQYPATTWVSTTVESSSLGEANTAMYKKLFTYIQGHNVKGMKMNTTTPIRTRIVPCHGATCATMFIQSFLIPADVSENTPYPLDPELFVEKDPPARYAVRVFDGRPTETEWLEESHKLADLLKKDPSIDRSYYYIAWYDPPYQLFHRTNEIWMARKAVKDTPATGSGLDLYETKEHKNE